LNEQQPATAKTKTA